MKDTAMWKGGEETIPLPPLFALTWLVAGGAATVMALAIGSKRR
jgi:hypothetical protein